MAKLFQTILNIPALCMIALIKCYQLLVSPWLGPCCRFKPTCSSYFIQSLRKYGLFLGTYRGVLRICRCHPWSGGGYDPP